MNSALKPVLPAAAGGQASPAKANVASTNHSTPALAQGTQNSVHVGNSLVVGQNLSAHNNVSPAPLHAVPSMAPVTANMAQMAQNMSHHGNLSHVSQNSATPTVMAASPSKSASTSSPLSLVQDKPTTPNAVPVPNATAPSQPLALTRTPEKKEPDSTGQANGTIESPKSATPPTLKPPNTEVNKEKQDIAKTSPSTPKPPEKPSVTPSTPQKAEPAPSTAQGDGPAQAKVATANEAPEKSPSKPVELKPAPTADVAPSQSDNKPTPESAKENQGQEKPLLPQKEEKPVEAPPKEPVPAEAKLPEAKVEHPISSTTDSKKPDTKPESAEKSESPKKADTAEKVAEKPLPTPKPEESSEASEKKAEVKPAPTKVEKPAPKSTLKLATVTTPVRKRRQTSPSKADGATPAKKVAEQESTPSTPSDTRMKRNRTQVQLYQSPTPELTMATKLSASAGRSTPTKPNEDKLIVIYKYEFLAVRNAEGGFYVCQAMQNVYRTTRKIKIRWLSQDKTADPSGETYKPDFYDVTDMECLLTTLTLQRAGGGAYTLSAAEHARTTSILTRALAAETGATPTLTEEHPDGLDLSLYTDESQLEKKSRRRAAGSSHNTSSDSSTTPSPKKARTTPKRSPKSKGKTSSRAANKNKKKPAGTTPVEAPASKTATAVTEKAQVKTPAKPSPRATPNKKPAKTTPVKKEVSTPTPTRKGRRAAALKELKSSPATPVPSTSTGKATRTPRKPPSKK